MDLCAADTNNPARQKEEEGVCRNNHGLLRIADADVVDGCADKERSSNTEESA